MSPAWKTENAAITDADMTFDCVTFTARTLVRLVKLSVELFEDADPSSEDVIARAFASQLALELDRVALRGTGTAPEPRGVLNTSGVTVTTHGANGGEHHQLRLADRRGRRGAGQQLRAERAPRRAAHGDLAGQAEGSDHQRLPGAAAVAAAPAAHQADPDQPHRGHQHRHQRDLHRAMGPAA